MERFDRRKQLVFFNVPSEWLKQMYTRYNNYTNNRIICTCRHRPITVQDVLQALPVIDLFLSYSSETQQKQFKQAIFYSFLYFFFGTLFTLACFRVFFRVMRSFWFSQSRYHITRKHCSISAKIIIPYEGTCARDLF